MEELIKIVEAECSDYQEFYLNKIYSLTEKQRNDLLVLINKMRKAGAKKPFFWAFSEITENIPQFARFSFLRELEDINRSVREYIRYTQEYDEERDEFNILHKKLEQCFSSEELERYLQIYTKVIVGQFIYLLDEGNPRATLGEPNWTLSEIDDNFEHHRFINGLHESFYEINEEIDWKLIERELQE
ncbi:hypothetical protein BKG93_07020 [Rodentibacter ratti]|uniref:Uncharacterized protein n=1 Tax=Rodentibacter ratti TaxID=1906745 RepID=A0A1V3L415_9PAST|nr:hypothetical protein [Rodentibacter ratti]OOF84595.1 hypothetical protein BKG93_07020 [Rodentibacter ratti]